MTDYFKHQLPDSKVRDKKMNREDLGPGPSASARPRISFCSVRVSKKAAELKEGEGGKVTDDGAIIQSRTVNFAGERVSKKVL